MNLADTHITDLIVQALTGQERFREGEFYPHDKIPDDANVTDVPGKVQPLARLAGALMQEIDSLQDEASKTEDSQVASTKIRQLYLLNQKLSVVVILATSEIGDTKPAGASRCVFISDKQVAWSGTRQSVLEILAFFR